MRGSRKNSLGYRSNSARTELEALENRRMLAAHIVGSSAIYASIQAAINAAASGQTITVDPGSYFETVLINKSLTLLGAKSGVDARSNLRGSGSGETVVTG